MTYSDLFILYLDINGESQCGYKRVFVFSVISNE